MDTKAVLTAKITEINGHVRSMLELYMSWYTFYWLLNAAVLAWKHDSTSSGNLPTYLCLIFFAMSLPATGSSFFVMGAALKMSKDMDAIYAALSPGEADRDMHKLIATPIWPEWTIRWGLSVNGIATFLLGGFWFYLLF